MTTTDLAAPAFIEFFDTGYAALFLPMLVGFGVWLFNRRNSDKRTIDWLPQGLSTIVNGSLENYSGGLQLSYNGTPIKNAYTCSVRIENTGSQTIKADEILRPLTLTFHDAKCYEATISNTSDNSLASAGASLINSPSSIISYDLPTQNKGDWVQIDMVVDGKHSRFPDITIKFENPTRDMVNFYTLRRKSARNSFRVCVGVLLSAIAALIFFGITGDWSIREGATNPPPAWYSMLFFVSFGAFFLAGVFGAQYWSRTSGEIDTINRIGLF